MAHREVRAKKTSPHGDIEALCSEGDDWSPRWKTAAIRDIETGVHRYFVQWTAGITWVHVVNGSTGKYLRTDKDSSSRNNLEDLPDC